MSFSEKIAANSKYILIVLMLFAAGIVHGINMFNFPYYEADEGTYMSQAWAVTDLGKLSPYSYVYDHAPGGWILLALWAKLTGGFFTFGFSVNSGRVLMLALHLVSTLFLFFTTNKLVKNNLISAISALLFSLSPLGIYFQRRVLLDNILVFWLLGSLTVLLHKGTRILNVLLSGLLLGIAIITKANAIFFTPAFLYLVFVSNPKRRFSSLTVWLFAVSIPILPYFLYAFSRGELFPYGSAFGGVYPHVSLIGTWIEQMQRSGGSIADIRGPFWQVPKGWFQSDPFMVIFGLGSTILNIFFGLKSLPNRIAAIFSLVFLAFLFRGGLVLEFYFLPLLPFFALNIAIAFGSLFGVVNKNFFAVAVTVVILNLLFFGSRSKNEYNLFFSDQTSPQIEAVDWILSQNLPRAFYVIDNYGYVDLYAKRNGHFRYADYYWKVDYDTDVYVKKLDNQWQNINYIAATLQMERDVAANPGLKLTHTALRNSKSIKQFTNDGWWVEIRQVNSSSQDF